MTFMSFMSDMTFMSSSDMNVIIWYERRRYDVHVVHVIIWRYVVHVMSFMLCYDVHVMLWRSCRSCLIYMTFMSSSDMNVVIWYERRHLIWTSKIWRSYEVMSFMLWRSCRSCHMTLCRSCYVVHVMLWRSCRSCLIWRSCHHLIWTSSSDMNVEVQLFLSLSPGQWFFQSG